VQLGAEYPCCGRQARFSTEEKEQAFTIKVCRNCKKTWVVKRSMIQLEPRIDGLHWEVSVS
jgi:hypothetical protein